MQNSLEATEALSQFVVKSSTTRVSLADIETGIADEQLFNMGVALAAMGRTAPESTTVLSVCLLTMKNGFTVVGKAAPADAANFNQDVGFTFAREDAIRQLWPLMGYAMRDKILAGRPE